MRAAARLYEQACGEEEDGLSLLPFTLFMLAPANDAVASLRQDSPTSPLASYWLSASHNSCAQEGDA